MALLEGLTYFECKHGTWCVCINGELPAALLPGNTDLDPWIGLENPGGNSCTNSGCNMSLKWVDGSDFIHYPSYMAGLSINVDASHTGTFFQRGSLAIAGVAAATDLRASATLCMSNCSSNPVISCPSTPSTYPSSMPLALTGPYYAIGFNITYVLVVLGPICPTQRLQKFRHIKAPKISTLY